MPQIKILHVGSNEYPNVSGAEMFTGNEHLQLNLIGGDDANNVNIWVEREGDNTSAKKYELSNDNLPQVEFEFFLDEGSIPYSAGTCFQNGVVVQSSVNMDLDATSHFINLILGDIKYGSVYKYGMLKQNKSITGETSGDDEEVTYAIGDATKTWMEHSVPLTGRFTYVLEPVTTDWVSITDSEGREITVDENTGNSERECYVKYTLKLGEDEYPETIILHIKQGFYKDVNLDLQIDCEPYFNTTDTKKKNELNKMFLPMEVDYFTRSCSSISFWDKLSEFRKKTKTLNGGSDERWDEIEVFFGDTTLSDGTVVGMSTNDLNFKWFDFKADAMLLNQKKVSTTFDTITCDIDGINKVKKTAWYVVDHDEETDELTYDSLDFYSFTDYTSAIVILRESLRNNTNDSTILLYDNIQYHSLATILLNNIDTTNISGCTVVFVPYGVESTMEGEYMDFVYKGLQNSTGIYEIEYDGNNIVGTPPESVDKIILDAAEVGTSTNTSLFLGDDDPYDFKDPNNKYYYAVSGFSQNLKIKADFSASTINTSKGSFTYYPLIMDIVHTAEYSREFDDSVIDEELLYEGDGYKIYRYKLKEVEDNITLGIEGYENTLSGFKHVAESGVVHFYIDSYADDAIPRTPTPQMFDLLLKCDIDLLHRYEYDGLTDEPEPPAPPEEEFTLTVIPNPEEGGTAYINDNTSLTATTMTSGTSVTVHAVKNSHYEWINWTESGTLRSSSENYSFEMPARDVTLDANFNRINIPEPPQEDEFTLRVHLDSVKGVNRGLVWIEEDEPAEYDEQSVVAGTNVCVHAGEFDCCMPFIQWAETDKSTTGITGAGIDYCFDMPAHDVDLYASFEDCPCEVSVDYKEEEKEDGTYEIEEPTEKRTDTEYYFVVKNATSGVLKVIYYHLSNKPSFNLQPGEIGEISMLWSAEWVQWVGRYAITNDKNE